MFNFELVPSLSDHPQTKKCSKFVVLNSSNSSSGRLTTDTACGFLLLDVQPSVFVCGLTPGSCIPLTNGNLRRRTRERMQHNLAAALEVDPIPSISDTIENQVPACL